VGTVATVEDRKIEGETRSIGIRIYSPSADVLFPLMVYFHGGGFIAGDLGSHDVNCRNFCAGAQCVVMSVDYRLAPEHKFPAATDDCLYATRWASQHASEMRADPDRIVVAGDSAGANLAAVTAMRIRDEGGPSLENPFAAPLRASILTHLPPTMLITAEYDPLRDEGERYGRRLQDAGVRTTALRYDGMIHGFLSLTGIVDKADVALTDACGWLEDIFTDAPGSRLPARQ
jgi:acetyl esterase